MKRCIGLIVLLCLLLGGACLAEWQLPASLEVIEAEAFAGSGDLGVITMPESVRQIGASAFSGRTIERLELSANLDTIDDHALDGATIGEVTAPLGSYAYFWAVKHGFIEGEGSMTPADAFEWSEVDGGARIDKYTGNAPFVSVPDAIDGKTVVEIGEYAFEDCATLQGITFNSDIRRIGWAAFKGCTNVRSMPLPDSVAFIDSYAFEGCERMASFHYPVGLAEVGWDNNSNLNFFYGCTALKRIDVPEGVTKIPDSFFRCAESLEEVSLPSTLKEIGSNAFQHCAGIETLSFSEGLETIGQSAFEGMTKIKAMPLPDSVTFIGGYAFLDCESLESFHYPVSLERTERDNYWLFSVFNGCTALKRIDVPEGVARIPDSFFRYAESLEEINLPSTLRDIENCAFENCINVTALDIPEGVERIGDYAFAAMEKLQSITLPDSVTCIGNYMLKGCASLTHFGYPKSLETLDIIMGDSGHVFDGCEKLTRVDVPEGVERLPGSIFCNAEYLQEVNLPTTLKEIGDSAFANCTGIETLELHDGLEAVWSGAFKGMTKLKAMILPDSVKTIGNALLEGCVNVTGFGYPLSLESVDILMGDSGHVFDGCEKLTRVDVPEGVERLPGSIFCNAEYLQEVNLPTTLKEIGDNAFRNCVNIAGLDFPEGLEAAYSGAFAGMTKMTALNLPDNVRTIGNSLVQGCVNLTYFHYPLSLESVDIIMGDSGYVFDGCEKLARVDVPEGVTFIPAWMFGNAPYLEAVELPMSLRKVYDCAFMNSTAIGEVYLNEWVDEIADNAFENTTLTINCEWGTYALAFAQAHGNPYFYLSRTGEYELNGAHWPSGRWYKGDPYIFDGYVRSSVNVSNVTGAIYTSAGAQVRSANYDPADTDHQLAGQFSNAMDIAGLDLGSYRFVLEGSAGGKHERLVETTFEIVPPPLRVRCVGLNVPQGFYAEEDPIPVEGTVISNYPIQIAFGAFTDDGSRTTQVYDGMPGGFTYELASAGLDMTALNGSGYQFLVTVSGNGESITCVCSDFTRSGFGPEGTVTSVDTGAVEQFVSNGNNHGVFYSLGVDYYSQLMDSLSAQDKFKLAMYTFDDKVRGTIIDMIRMPLDSGTYRSEYLVQLYKKEIASFISAKGPIVDSMFTYKVPDKQKLADKIMKAQVILADDLVPDTDGITHSEAVKLAKKANSTFYALHQWADIAGDVEDFLELSSLMADAMKDYSYGIQVLDTIAATTLSNADTDYNYQIALQELKKEYTDKCVNCMDTFVNYVANKIAEKGEKEAIKAVITAVGGGELYAVYKLSKIGWDIFTEKTDFYGDVGRIVTYKAQIDTFYAANRAYQEAFDEIANGNGDESTAIRLVNAFQYAKDAAWRSIGTLKGIHYYTAITSDVTLNSIQQRISKLKCP